MSGETTRIIKGGAATPAGRPQRGRGGPQLKPDAFAGSSSTPPEPARQQDTLASPALAEASTAIQIAKTRRSLRAQISPALVGAQGRAQETLGRLRRFQRRARVRVSDTVSSARLRISTMWATPRDTLCELEVAARGRTISNRIETLSELDRDETDFIRDFAMSQTRTYQSGSDIVRERERAPEPAFIASGWACRLRIGSGGRRQIVGFLLPGDAIGMRGAAEPDATTTIGALTQVESVDARELLSRVERSNRYSNLERAIQRAEAQEKEFLMNQVARLGGMSPHERLADLMCELQWRLRQAGLADENMFPMPLDRRDLTSTLNMNSRELNAALRRLKRKQGFRIRNRGARLPTVDGEAQGALGGFLPPMSSGSPGTAPLPRIISTY